MIETADYLVMESTYGNRMHVRNDEKASIFLNIVYETLEKNGTVVIPSFTGTASLSAVPTYNL